MRTILLFFLSTAAALLGQKPDSPIPGQETAAETKALEMGAELLQSEAPLRKIHAHVCGFHFYSGEPGRQVIAHHYCSHLNDEVMQCVIFDSDKAEARLIGIEYIISARLFSSLSEDEKKLWHSHVYEVKSGQLIAPRLPDAAEKELMKHLVGTYGKTWHTWQIDRGDPLPLGIPQLMMGFTADGQIAPKTLADRDRGYGIATEKKRDQRADVPTPPIIPGANAWEREPGLQLKIAPFE